MARRRQGTRVASDPKRDKKTKSVTTDSIPEDDVDVFSAKREYVDLDVKKNVHGDSDTEDGIEPDEILNLQMSSSDDDDSEGDENDDGEDDQVGYHTTGQNDTEWGMHGRNNNTLITMRITSKTPKASQRMSAAKKRLPLKMRSPQHGAKNGMSRALDSSFLS